MEATPGYCASCDRRTFVYDVGAFDFTLFCRQCIKRYGEQALRETANAALAIREEKNKPKVCLRCGAPLVSGSTPMCHECNSAYAERFGGAKVRWQ